MYMYSGLCFIQPCFIQPCLIQPAALTSSFSQFRIFLKCNTSNITANINKFSHFWRSYTFKNE